MLWAVWIYRHSLTSIETLIVKICHVIITLKALHWKLFFAVSLPSWFIKMRHTRYALVNSLTHWGRVTHLCVGKLTIIGSNNGLSPGRRQAIIWTNAGILLIGPLGTHFSEISIKILTFSFTKMRLKVSSAKWRPFCLGLNVLNQYRD